MPTANITRVSHVLRKHLAKASDKPIAGIKSFTYLYKIGQPKVTALRLSRQAVIDILNNLSLEWGINLYPFEEKDLKYIKSTSATLFVLASFVQKRLIEEGRSINKDGTLTKKLVSSQAPDEIDPPAPEEIPSVDVNEDVKCSAGDNTLTYHQHASKVIFVFSSDNCREGSVVSVTDESGNQYFVANEVFEGVDTCIFTNDIFYARVFDLKFLEEAFKIENGVLTIRDDTDSVLANTVNQLVTYTVEKGNSCTVNLSPVNRNENTKVVSFDFGPVDPMEEIESLLSPAQQEFLRKKLNENR